MNALTVSRVNPAAIFARLETRAWVWSLAAWLLPFAVYWHTLAPTVYGLDSAELTTGAFALGIVHAPGSPTYLLIGHLFSWLPIGDVGYRLNLMSAVATASAVMFTYHILLDITGRRGLALATAWFLGFSYYFWISAVAAELYSLAVCFFAALLWLTLRWRTEGAAWQLYLVAFLFGLGLGVHASLILLAPGFLWLVCRPFPQWRQWLVAALCGFAGVCVYLYIPIRYAANPAINYAGSYWHIDLATWDGFWWMVTARMFKSLFFAIPLDGWPNELLLYLYRLWSNFVGIGCLIGLIGLVSDLKRRWSLQIGLVLMLVSYLAFYIPYGAGDKDTMFLPTFLIWGIEIGLGLTVLGRLLARWTISPNAILPAAMLLLAVSALVLNLHLADLSRDYRARQWGEAIFSTIEPNAFYFGNWADVPILEYLQVVEGKQRQVTTVNLFFTGREQGIEMALEKLRAGIPVYTASPVLSNDEIELQRNVRCQCYQAVLHTTSSGR